MTHSIISLGKAAALDPRKELRSRLSARSVLQNACGLLRSPLATRTSALLLRASCPEGQLVRLFQWAILTH